MRLGSLGQKTTGVPAKGVGKRGGAYQAPVISVMSVFSRRRRWEPIVSARLPSPPLTWSSRGVRVRVDKKKERGKGERGSRRLSSVKRNLPPARQGEKAAPGSWDARLSSCRSRKAFVRPSFLGLLE